LTKKGKRDKVYLTDQEDVGMDEDRNPIRTQYVQEPPIEYVDPPPVQYIEPPRRRPPYDYQHQRSRPY